MAGAGGVTLDGGVTGGGGDLVFWGSGVVILIFLSNGPSVPPFRVMIRSPTPK